MPHITKIENCILLFQSHINKIQLPSYDYLYSKLYFIISESYHQDPQRQQRVGLAGGLEVGGTSR
jgi:hypothetical protein